MEAEVAGWAQHYARHFTRAALEIELESLVPGGQRQFAYGKEHEREPRLAALRQLLANPTAQYPNN